ncbi:hypothetical protein D3C78_677450 [compost metagenome]
MRTFHAQLPTLAQAKLAAIGVDHLQRSPRYRNAHRAQPDKVAIGIGGDHWRGFGQAVAFHHRTAGHGLPALGRRGHQRGAAGVGDLEIGEVQVLEFRMLHQRDEQRVQAEQRGEAPLLQLLDEAADITRIGDQHVVVAIDHHAHAVRGEGIDVVQRQRCDHHLLAFLHQRPAVRAQLRQAGVDLLHVGDQVSVSEHRALGQARGATGVLQHGEIVQAGPDRLQRVAAPQAQGFGEAHGGGQAVVRHHLLHVLDHCIDQQPLERRQHVAHARFDQVLDAGVGQHLLYQLAEQVDVDQRPRARVLELVAHLAGGVQRVGIDHHQPGPQRAEHGDRVLQDVRHLHGDAVARLEIGVALQIGGKGGGQAIQLGIAERHTQVAEGRAVGESLAGAFEDLDHRLVGLQVDLVGNTGGAFVIPEIRLHLLFSSYLSTSDPRTRPSEGT